MSPEPDQCAGYKKLADHGYPHRAIGHRVGQYVVGAVHAQTIEGFWSILNRGDVGTFHKISKKYLPLFVVEFQFHYNNRLNADIFRAMVVRC